MTTKLSLRVSQKQLKHAGVSIFCLLAFLLPYQMDFYVPQLFGINLTPILILSFIVLTLLSFEILIFRRLPIIPHWGWWAMFLTLASVAYALGPQVTSPLQGIWIVFRFAFAPLLFYAGALMLLSTSDFRRIIKILAISAAIAGLIAVIQTLSGGLLLGGFLTNHRYLGFMQPLLPEVVIARMANLSETVYLAGTSIYRGHGTFYSHNGFGAFISVTAGLSWGLLRSATGKRRWFWLIIFIAQVMGSIASFSRSSWAAVVAGMGVAILMEVIFVGGKRAISRMIRLVPVFLVLVIIIGVVVSRSEKITEHFLTIFNPAKVPEFVWRQMVWETTLQKVKAHPLVGAGATSVVTLTDWAGAKTSYGAHNLLLGIAYELGIPSLILFLLFTVSLFLSAWHCSKHALSTSERLLAVGFWAAGVSFLVAGIGGALMTIENIAVLFWLIVGMANKSRRQCP